MKFLFASDSFKGSLSSKRINELLEKAAHIVFPTCYTEAVPMADGGEGTLEAVISATGGEYITVPVSGPLGLPLNSKYGVIGVSTSDLLTDTDASILNKPSVEGKNNCRTYEQTIAVIEMAKASGLTLIEDDERNAGMTSTFGTGELICDALNRGYRKIVIAIGGSATNDGGMGCMRALGAHFLDSEGKELTGIGNELIHVNSIDISEFDQRLNECDITIMCDVDNPLCGPCGATMTYGKQKGATDKQLENLERGMQNYKERLKERFGVDCDMIPGAGAAGGLGGALKVFTHGHMRSGIETVLDLVGFDHMLDGTDLVITGEGCTDAQSCWGKVMQGVGDRAAKYGVPAVGLVGSMGEGAEEIYAHGVCSLFTTVNAPMSINEAMANANELYYGAAERMFRLLKTGALSSNRK